MILIQSIRRALRDSRGLATLAAAGALLPFMPSTVLAAEDVELAEVVVEGRSPERDADRAGGIGVRLRQDGGGNARAVTTISNELLEQTIITEIDDLVALTPGAFTQSFFGVAGSLDVRGNPGENYFRGVKRIDNPGNYPTAIGASDRIDIVRGPASLIYGPSKIGGYLNFVPKSARAKNGRYLGEATGQIGATFGSFDKQAC